MQAASLYPACSDDIHSAEAYERLYDELELVSYVTSHDLQAPLRAIQSSCETLCSNPAYASDPALQELQREAARLKELMQGMLDDVRLEIFPVTHTPLDSNELLQTAITTLSEEIKATGATIHADTLPKVLGHRNRLTRLFAHLLDNALKFHGAHPPVINVSARSSGGQWEFCIADNGIGIDEDNHDIIFRLFQRLHSDGAYKGHGIGLSLARKIVESHGGALRVESSLDNGSRFYFTLPAVAQ